MTNYKQEVQGFILSSLYDLCYRAHSNTSFSPERRSVYYVKEYSDLLESDLKELGDNAGNYKEKFIAKFSEWMAAKGRCISSMITGGSNFPVRRAQKANSAERNKSEAFSYWRERYFKAVNRVPTKSPEDEILDAEIKLENSVNAQLEMKEINTVIRKSKIKELKPLIAHLLELEYKPVFIGLIDNYYGRQTGKYKIPGYVLSNNNATIKRLKDKVKIMYTRIERKNKWQDIIFDGGYVTIEDDRLKIYHDSKPERTIINEIKSNGYRWSPHWGCWCRKHTGNAIYSLRFLSFLKDKAA